MPLADAQAGRIGSAELSCRECTGLNWYCVQNPNAWDFAEWAGLARPHAERLWADVEGALEEEAQRVSELRGTSEAILIVD